MEGSGWGSRINLWRGRINGEKNVLNNISSMGSLRGNLGLSGFRNWAYKSGLESGGKRRMGKGWSGWGRKDRALGLESRGGSWRLGLEGRLLRWKRMRKINRKYLWKNGSIFVFPLIQKQNKLKPISTLSFIPKLVDMISNYLNFLQICKLVILRNHFSTHNYEYGKKYWIQMI